MIRKLIYHLFLIIVFIVSVFAGHFFYSKYVIIYASNNSEKPVKDEKIEQPIYLTKAPKCEEIKGIELSLGFNPPKNYSGWAKYCSDSTGNVLAHGEVLNGEFNGVWINYNENGSFSDERLWIVGKREGKVKKYLDGKIALLGQFVNNKQQGEWKYYEDGELSAIGKFVNGKKQGEWKYYEDGELESGKHINGKLEGKWKKYKADGSLKRVQTWKNDELQSCEGECDDN
jgi:hypothetical protein